MRTKRVIARLDIKGPNLVKGISMEGLRVLGKPSDFARYYYQQGADELLFIDVVASLYGRNNLHNIISETAKEIFIPITVGGGIRSIEDIREILRSGADKVCINTAAIHNPQLIRQAAEIFGSSTIVVAIEAIKETDGTYSCYTDNGREYTGIDVFEWARKVNDLGAGEIIITSVDREGTGMGFDYELISKLNEIVSIPVIVHGGAGSADHVAEMFKETDADAAALASLLHYHYIFNHSPEVSDEEGSNEFLLQKRNFHVFRATDIPTVKNCLSENFINIRHIEHVEKKGTDHRLQAG